MIKLVRIDYRLLHGQGFLPGPERWISTISSSPHAKAAADAFITMSL